MSELEAAAAAQNLAGGLAAISPTEDAWSRGYRAGSDNGALRRWCIEQARPAAAVSASEPTGWLTTAKALYAWVSEVPECPKV